MRWFRFHAEALDNPKIQKLRGDLFKAWVNFMCLASEDGGRLPDIPALAFRLRMTPKKALDIRTTLVVLQLVDEHEEGFVMHDWDAWQFLSDDSNARVIKYRNTRKNAGLAHNGYLKHKKSILERDGGRCVYCGSTENLCIDHVVPVQLGGDDDPLNLAVACKACNTGKSGRTPDMAGLNILPDSVYVTLYSRNVTRLHKAGVHAGVHDVASVSVLSSESEKEKKKLPCGDWGGFEIESRFQAYRKRHPGVQTRLGACRAAYTNLLVSSIGPKEMADSLDAKQEKWLAYWSDSNSKAQPLGLLNFLLDGDCMVDPPEVIDEDQAWINAGSTEPGKMPERWAR